MALLLILFLLAGNRLVSIGDRRLSIDCDGPPGRSPTVVLIAGGGRTAKDWLLVHPEVARFLEQSLKLHEIDPKGPAPDSLTAQLGFYVKPGERLEWRTELSMIVLGHGKPYPRTAQMTEEQWTAWDQIWRSFQLDLAKRSTHGEFRLAEQSGHFIQKDQPELVVQAIRDVTSAK
jgi:pimeloyl-ACP methyl ester carboxylesterase